MGALLCSVVEPLFEDLPDVEGLDPKFTLDVGFLLIDLFTTDSLGLAVAGADFGETGGLFSIMPLFENISLHLPRIYKN